MHRITKSKTLEAIILNGNLNSEEVYRERSDKEMLEILSDTDGAPLFSLSSMRVRRHKYPGTFLTSKKSPGRSNLSEWITFSLTGINYPVKSQIWDAIVSNYDGTNGEFNPGVLGFLDNSITMLSEKYFSEMRAKYRDTSPRQLAALAKDPYKESELHRLRRNRSIEEFTYPNGVPVFDASFMATRKGKRSKYFRSDGGWRLPEMISYATTGRHTKKKEAFLNAVFRKYLQGEQAKSSSEIMNFLATIYSVKRKEPIFMDFFAGKGDKLRVNDIRGCDELYKKRSIKEFELFRDELGQRTYSWKSMSSKKSVSDTFVTPNAWTLAEMLEFTLSGPVNINKIKFVESTRRMYSDNQQVLSFITALDPTIDQELYKPRLPSDIELFKNDQGIPIYTKERFSVLRPSKKDIFVNERGWNLVELLTFLHSNNETGNNRYKIDLLSSLENHFGAGSENFDADVAHCLDNPYLLLDRQSPESALNRLRSNYEFYHIRDDDGNPVYQKWNDITSRWSDVFKSKKGWRLYEAIDFTFTGKHDYRKTKLLRVIANRYCHDVSVLKYIFKKAHGKAMTENSFELDVNLHRHNVEFMGKTQEYKKAA